MVTYKLHADYPVSNITVTPAKWGTNLFASP
jgi:hypothetical protein